MNHNPVSSFKHYDKNGAPGGDRTHDLGIKSPLLYLLSYWHENGTAGGIRTLTPFGKGF